MNLTFQGTPFIFKLDKNLNWSTLEEINWLWLRHSYMVFGGFIGYRINWGNRLEPESATFENPQLSRIRNHERAMTNSRKENGRAQVCDQRELCATPGWEARLLVLSFSSRFLTIADYRQLRILEGCGFLVPDCYPSLSDPVIFHILRHYSMILNYIEKNVAHQFFSFFYILKNIFVTQKRNWLKIIY